MGKPISNATGVDVVELTEHAEAVRNSEESAEMVQPDHSMNRTKWLACISLGLSYTTAVQQQASTSTIVKHIDIALGPTTYFNWMISGHSITAALILPLAGGLSDIFGRRWFFIAGCLFSMTGIAVALAATSVPMVIAGMVLKGVGSGAQQLSLAAIGELVPNKHRGTAQALLDLVGLPWMVFGALVGNSLVKHYTLSFKINFIIGILLNALTITSIFFWYHPPPGRILPGESRLRKVMELDWLGIGLLACGISLTLVGISLGGSQFPWASAAVVAPVVLGLVSFAVLVVWEWRFAKNPFFPHELFEGDGDRFGLVLLLTLVVGMALYSTAAFWTQQSQAMFFKDPTKIGLSAIPSGLGGAIGGFFGGILLGKGKFFRANLLLSYGAVLKLIADGLFTTITPNRLALALGSSFMGMFGIGAMMIALIVCTQLSCSDKHIGLATLVLGSVRSIGGSLAVTVFSSIMNNTVQKDADVRIRDVLKPFNVPESSFPKLIRSLIGGRPNEALKLPGVTQASLDISSAAIKWSWAKAFQRIYDASLAFTALALITAFFIKDVSHNMTDNVAVTLQNDTENKGKKQAHSEL